MGSFNSSLIQLLRGAYLQLRDKPDPHAWLEEVENPQVVQWVDAHTAATTENFGQGPYFERSYTDLLAIIGDRSKLPRLRQRGNFLYELYRSEEHPRGIWRRTTPASFVAGEPSWDILLDLDALAQAEGIPWVWGGASLLPPLYERGLISLSRGGSDAVVVREFDVIAREFVPNGFCLPEAKSQVSWIDLDTVFLSTNWGEGTLTNSGYPRLAKRWRRGQSFEEAELVFQGSPSAVSVSAFRDHTPGFERDVIVHGIDFFSREYWLLEQGITLIPIPKDASASFYREWLIVELRTPWVHSKRSFAAGSLIVTNFNEFLAGRGNFEELFVPSEKSSLEGFCTTANTIVVTELEKGRCRIHAAVHKDGQWIREPVSGLPENSTIVIMPSDPDRSDDVQVLVEDFITPPALFFGHFEGSQLLGLDTAVATQRPLFDITGIEVSHHEARSEDGTLIPYFQVGPGGGGKTSVIVRGYGGFGISMVPSYAPKFGKVWLEQGGTFVVACIRGGGEYGPSWHDAARKQHRHRAYEDFVAVARDLCRRGVSTPSRIGAWGGSNGGLLTGNMLVTYPEDWGAIVSAVPLLDMYAFPSLLAGASWVAEYGNPRNPLDWGWLRRYSPYHQLQRGAKYPPALFTTSRRDDRVHPAHARKMVARMEAMQLRDTFLFERADGGHSGTTTPAEEAYADALVFSFLARYLSL
jgi:prolyl oligopeptidase